MAVVLNGLVGACETLRSGTMPCLLINCDPQTGDNLLDYHIYHSILIFTCLPIADQSNWVRVKNFLTDN